MGKDNLSCINPEKFNELYLPVQWTNDDNNPGVLDPDELWVHPELLAINAFLRESGQETLDPQKFVEIGMNHIAGINSIKAFHEKRIKHPLLIKDIASRNRMRFESNLKDYPEGAYRTAIAELVKAAALAEIYFNLQRNPDYLNHLKTILDSGDYVRLRHLWQNKSPECVSVKDEACTSLPGIKMDPNGTYWPDEFTKEDIDVLNPPPETTGYKWQSEELKRKVFTTGSRIIECTKDDVDAFEYKGKFYRPTPITSDPNIAILARMMAGHLRRAAEALKDEAPGLSRLLYMRADDTEKPGIFGNPELDKVWIETNDPKLTTAFGRVENYSLLGAVYGIKAGMQAVIGYNDEQLQKFITTATSLMNESNARLWKLWQDNGEEFPLDKIDVASPEAVVVNLIMNSGAMNAVGYIAGGFIQPNYDNYEKDVSEDQRKTKFVLYGPICAARIQYQGMPLAKLAFDEKTVKDLEPISKDHKMIILAAEAHEIGHALAGGTDLNEAAVRRFDMKKMKTSNIYGTSLSKALEEMKADLLGLYNLPLYEANGIITDNEKLNIYRAYFGEMLRNLNLDTDEAHGHGSLLTFYLLCKHGVITYNNETGKYSYHVNLQEERMPKIVKEALDIYYSFDRKVVEDFDRKVFEFFKDSPMRKYVAEIQAAHLPKDNLPYYMVKGDLGDF